ncbi:MAG: thioredoxin family protein [Verrucomicrobia bacterium]|nr:thioredoxin family protein [Verrucomicrobiota bacterium]MBI3870257.1 thioredoxin family protein [Verrucomicrobiota bacterium]
MALTPSTMPPLATSAPAFRLPEPLTGQAVSLADFASSPLLLVMFLSNHCPYVKHVRDSVSSCVKEYQPRGLAVVAINCNDVSRYPDDSPGKMVEEVRSAGYTFPYLFDESQETAKAYRAACTPDFFLFDRDRKLVYRGQLDDSRPGNGVPVTCADLRAALDAGLSGRPPLLRQRPSMGCGIKWKPGNAPDYR